MLVKLFLLRRQRISKWYLLCYLVILMGISFLDINAQIDTDEADTNFILSSFAIIDIEPIDNHITLELNTPSEAGMPLTTSFDNSLWLNYTSCIEASGTARNISAEISNGFMPLGVNLTLEASNILNGNAAGVLGNSNGIVILDGTSKQIIGGIGGAYTGTGVGNGHQLTYSLSIADYNQLDFDATTTIEVTYTITD